MHLPLSLVLAACLAAPLEARVPQQAPDPELAEARSKYERTEEGECKEATEICVRKNNVAAVELMLTVLRLDADRPGFLASAHYRDVVWGWTRYASPIPTRANASRQRCARRRRATGCGNGAPSCSASTTRSSSATAWSSCSTTRTWRSARAAAKSLGQVKATAALKPLLACAGDKDEILRENAVEALARIEPATQKALFVKALKDKDGGVRCALLGAAPQIYRDDVEAWSVATFADKDWRPRMQAADNLGTIPTKGAVDALIKALADGRPAVAARAMRRLQELTGQKHTRKETWEAWWAANRETFSFPSGSAKSAPSGETTVAYHGIELTSDHVAFLIDKSAHMGDSLTSKSKSKEAAALEELGNVLAKLQGRLTFNVFAYNQQVMAFESKGPVDLTAKSREKALQFVERTPAAGSKDIWKLLETVVSDPELDTAYLLSSGEPTWANTCTGTA
jgi:hypothetical protein